MKKKIKDLTEEERKNICDNSGCKKCVLNYQGKCSEIDFETDIDQLESKIELLKQEEREWLEIEIEVEEND